MRRMISNSLAAVVVAGALLAGCGGGGEQSFTTPTYPFSFSYPDGWTVSRGANFTYGSSDTAVRSVSAALKEPYDQVTITQYKLKKTLPAGVNGYQPEVDRIVARLTKQAGGEAGDAKVVKYGGIPGYQYIVEYPGGGNVKLQNKLTFLFKGQQEFQINCQSSEKNRKALLEGCDQILGSLQFK
ncbi:MAG: hypothetical protein JHD02_05985 [Thermoleophilaceae bacterium]|nr:hypothetical protein [Thermoleophilaceae bacterium]